MLSLSCGCTDLEQEAQEKMALKMLQEQKRAKELAALEVRFGPKEQLAAAHILIRHKDTEDCPPGVTRNKEEALVRAQEVAAMAKADGADFAALAKAYSEGPSGPKGGDMGVFTPGHMVAPFSKATQELEVGGVSDPVETPFGYHIILRK